LGTDQEPAIQKSIQHAQKSQKKEESASRAHERTKFSLPGFITHTPEIEDLYLRKFSTTLNSQITYM
jgi:hypothetical protein